MKKLLLILSLVILPILAIAAAFFGTPHYAKHRINQRLANMENHQGSVESVAIRWFEAEVVLRNLLIRPKNSGYSQPLVNAPEVIVELLQVSPISSGFIFNSPRLFVAVEQNSEGQLGLGENWMEVLRDLVPLPIRSGKVHDGILNAYFNLPDEPLQPAITTIEAVLERQQVKGSADTVQLDLSANLQADGSASEIKLVTTSLADQPAAQSEVSLSIATTPLPPFNPLLRHYGGIDVSDGQYQLNLAAEVRNKQVDGTLSVSLSELDVLNFADDKPMTWLFEGLAGGLAALVGKGPDNKIDLDIPIAGELDDTKIGTRAEIVNQAKNLLPKITDWAF